MLAEELRRLFDKFLEKIMDFRSSHSCSQTVPIVQMNGVASLCRLFDVLGTVENGVRPKASAHFSPVASSTVPSVASGDHIGVTNVANAM